jgi:ornithine decarboxylase
MQILDVGGGFEDNNFEPMAHVLRKAISREFTSPPKLIAEPGRFYASGFYTMVCQVVARRIQKGITTKLPDMLYLNDGLYGSFSMKWSEGKTFVPTLIELPEISAPATRDWKRHRYSIWGPTCDSMDCISKEVVMNQEIMIGDWLKFQDMGGKRY